MIKGGLARSVKHLTHIQIKVPLYNNIFSSCCFSSRQENAAYSLKPFLGFLVSRQFQGLRSVLQLLYWEFIKWCPSIKIFKQRRWCTKLIHYPCCLLMGPKNAPSINFGSSSTILSIYYSRKKVSFFLIKVYYQTTFFVSAPEKQHFTLISVLS